MKIAEKENIRFDFINSPIENYKFQEKFDYIFSSKVMDYLKSPYSVVIHLMKYLSDSGKIRFFCPNYDYPYDPHFQKWLFRRKNNAFYLPAFQAESDLIDTSEWDNNFRWLNFLTLSKLDKVFFQANIRFTFSKDILRNLLQRGIEDVQLQNRHKWLTHGVRLAFKFRLVRLLNLLPKKFWPVIDIEITH